MVQTADDRASILEQGSPASFEGVIGITQTHEHPPLNRDYNRDPYIKALKRRGVINHGSTLAAGTMTFQISVNEKEGFAGTALFK